MKASFIDTRGTASGNIVLTKDTEPWTIYVGSPAKPVGKRDKEIILKNAKELGYE